MMLHQLDEKYEQLCGRLDALTAALQSAVAQNDQIHSLQYQEWEPFVATNAAAGVANTATVAVPTAALGWTARIHRIAVTVSGANSGAVVTAYRGVADPTHLIDAMSGMFGSSPSRLVGDYNSPIYCTDQQSITVVVSSLAGATDFVTVRIEGFRKQL